MSSPRSRLLFCGDVGRWPRRLRDQGHEVVLLEPGVAPEQLAAVAVQEDIDVVAVTDPDLGAAVVGSVGGDVVVFCITSDEGHS
jgi:hypothetical protein